MEILLVDDDPDLRDSAAMLLQSCGYSISTAKDADAALCELASGKSVCVMITDIMMPGMNGFELADKAKMRWPQLRVIYMTGYSRDALPDAQNLHGTLLMKPWPLDEMLCAIERCAA